MEYSEYLKTNHWKKTRERQLRFAERRCQLCNSNFKLHVHHRSYENLGHEKRSDLVVLCESCHTRFHDKIKQAVPKEILQYVKANRKKILQNDKKLESAKKHNQIIELLSENMAMLKQEYLLRQQYLFTD